MKKMRTILFCGAMGAAVAFSTVSSTRAAVLPFDNIGTGSFVGSQYFIQHGVTIAATNNNPAHPDVATIFDTNKTGTPDKDLQTGWVGGNLVGVNLGKILIVAENVKDSDNNGRIDAPDDERDGGNFFFSFSRPIQIIGLDVIDVEFATPIDYLEFFTNGVSTGTIGLDQFTNPSSPFYDPTIAYGDHTANRISPFNVARLGLPAFNGLIIHMGECAGVDNINFTPATAAPEPGMGLVAIGLPLLLGMRRRR